MEQKIELRESEVDVHRKAATHGHKQQNEHG